MKGSKCLIMTILFSLIIHFSYGQNPGELTTITKSFTDGVIDGYTIYLPKSYTKKSEKHPIILFLQGGSAVGGDIDVVNGWGIPKLLGAEKDLSTVRNQYLLDSFIVVSPHMTEGSFNQRQWYNQDAAIRQLLKEIIVSYQADPSRIYVTGLSRGGHGTWGLASRMSDIFAAAVPICGGLHGVEDFSTLTDIPIWTAHNTGDNMVGYDGTVNAVQKIEAQGGAKFLRINTVEAAKFDFLNHSNLFTTFDRDGHDAWTDIYGSLELYQWMLLQKKT